MPQEPHITAAPTPRRTVLVTAKRDRPQGPDPKRSREAVPANQKEVESSAELIDRLKGHHRTLDDAAGIDPGQPQGTDPRPHPDQGEA